MGKLSSRPSDDILEIKTLSFGNNLNRIQPNAAGIDIGAHEIWVCTPGQDGTQLVRGFGTYTPDLHAIRDWLAENHVKTIAMESTGVYWIPLFEVLELHGFHCCLISSRSIKRVPGRKSDVLDCQWIQTLRFTSIFLSP